MNLTWSAVEKKWLKNFFDDISTKLSCQELNTLLFEDSCRNSVLQAVWDELGSDKNLRFVAMSQYLNGQAKGMFFLDKGQFGQFYVDDPE